MLVKFRCLPIHELAIKWVNDLYYKGKKVCGILTEAGTDLESGQLEWLAVSYTHLDVYKRQVPAE